MDCPNCLVEIENHYCSNCGYTSPWLKYGLIKHMEDLGSQMYSYNTYHERREEFCSLLRMMKFLTFSVYMFIMLLLDTSLIFVVLYGYIYFLIISYILDPAISKYYEWKVDSEVNENGYGNNNVA